MTPPARDGLTSPGSIASPRHHDVNRTHWRQSRKFPGSPGRPPAPGWLMAAGRVRYRGREPGAGEAKTRAVRAAGSKSSMPRSRTDRSENKEQAIASARSLSVWIDEVLADIGKTPVDRAVALPPPRSRCQAARSESSRLRHRASALLGLPSHLQRDRAEGRPDIPIAKILQRTDEELGFSPLGRNPGTDRGHTDQAAQCDQQLRPGPLPGEVCRTERADSSALKSSRDFRQNPQQQPWVKPTVSRLAHPAIA